MYTKVVTQTEPTTKGNAMKTTEMTKQQTETDLQRGDYELSDLWEQLDSVEYRVFDDEGVNVANATVRHFNGDFWLYQDDTDGYRIAEESEVEGWYVA